MSTWQHETGVWNGKASRYDNRKLSEPRQKELTMELFKRPADERVILKFNGGPTGFESYLAEGLLDNILEDQVGKPADTPFCICGGTINSWPTVTVNKAEVVLFLADAKIVGVLK